MLLLILISSFSIQFIAVASYALKLSGVVLDRFATSAALINILLICSRAASALAIPIINKHTESALDQPLEGIEYIMRMYLIAGLAGGCVALLMFRKIAAYSEVIISDSKNGLVKSMFTSIPVLFSSNEKVIKGKAAENDISKTVFFANMLGNAVWVASPLAAIMAGVLVPEFRATAIHLSAVVNGFATIVLFSYCDPYFAKILDGSKVEGGKEVTPHTAMSGAARSYLYGIAIAQLMLLPCSYLIAWAAFRL